jgi:L-asparagine oxygenase
MTVGHRILPLLASISRRQRTSSNRALVSNQKAIAKKEQHAMASNISHFPGREVEIYHDPLSGLVGLSLSSSCAQHLRKAVVNVDCARGAADHPYVMGLRQVAFSQLPHDLLAVLEAVRNGSFAPTAVLIEGLPHDVVRSAPLPGEDSRVRKASDLSENLLVLLGSVLGEPYGIYGEGTRLVNNLIPTQGDRQLLTGNGSEIELDFHNENAAHRRLFRDRDLSPTGLLLSAVCAQEKAGPLTWVANGRMAAAALEPIDRTVLEGDLVRLALPVRQRRPGVDTRMPPGPILTGPRGIEVVTAAFYGDMMLPMTAEAGNAIMAYRAELKKVAVGIALKPGMVLYVPNAYSLHARDGFIPEFDRDGRAERWLQRIFVTGRLDAFQICAARSDRVFELPG